jgi:hypothetical protein
MPGDVPADCPTCGRELAPRDSRVGADWQLSCPASHAARQAMPRARPSTSPPARPASGPERRRRTGTGNELNNTDFLARPGSEYRWVSASASYILTNDTINLISAAAARYAPGPKTDRKLAWTPRKTDR